MLRMFNGRRAWIMRGNSIARSTAMRSLYDAAVWYTRYV